MNTKLWIVVPVLVAAGTALAAPAPPKSVTAGSLKRFGDFKKTTKPVDPKTKPPVSKVRIPGNTSGLPWCGITVGGKFECLHIGVKCPGAILLIGGAEGADYTCDVDCHGQTEAGADGTCECDIKYDTCKAAN